MSVAVGSGAGKSLEMPVKINNNAMTGKYILVTAVVNPENFKVVSLGQTTFNVVAAPQAEMCASWWIILLLIIIILLVVAIYWLFIRKKE
jgi:hypothetical protein